MQSKLRDYSRGDIVFRQGEVGNAAYILTQGSVEISMVEDKNKVVLDILTPVAVFGEMALLLKDKRRTATATILGPAKVAEISKKDFDDFFQKSPKLISAVLKAMVSRLQHTNVRVMNSPDLYTMLTETLYLMAQHSKFNDIRYKELVVCMSKSSKISQKEVIKTIDFLETIGLIEIRIIDKEHKSISILKPLDFIDRARKIYKTFARMGTTPDSGITSSPEKSKNEISK